jgi:hypothetical protein
VRALGGEHNAIRAEQLRALGNNDRVIARVLRVERDAVVRWFAIQDEIALQPDGGGDADGAA